MSSLASFRSRLTGSWNLISYTATSTSNPSDIVYPLGKSCRGRAIFSTDGYVSAHIQSSDIRPYSDGRFHASAEELCNAAKRTLTYTGAFRLEEGQCGAEGNAESNGKATIYYDVEISLPPNWIGTTEVRELEMMDGDDGETYLYLRPPGTVEIAGVTRQAEVKTVRARDNSGAGKPEIEKGKL